MSIQNRFSTNDISYVQRLFRQYTNHWSAQILVNNRLIFVSTFLDLILAFELYWKHKLFYSTILLDWVNRNDYLTTRSATEIWFIGNPKSDLNTTCLPTNGDVPLLFSQFQKSKCRNKWCCEANDCSSNWNSVEIEKSYEKRLAHSKQFLKIFESWKKSVIDASRKKRNNNTERNNTKNFVKVWKHYLISLLKALSNKFLVIV